MLRDQLVLSKNILKGLLTHIPGLYGMLRPPTGGTNSALYCYAVWMRHLLLGYEKSGMSIPKVVAEIGPGDSLGTSIAALLSGTEKVYALDVVRYSATKLNLDLFDELVALFQKRTSIPTQQYFPNLKPKLDDYSFPDRLFPENYLKKCLDPDRLAPIRHSIECSSQGNSMITYHVPWNEISRIKQESVDFIFSQAVLEHAEDLPATYQAISKWLKPNGIMSHQIDFKSHGITEEWNGHWKYSQFIWKIIKGNRPYLINRHPCSSHLLAIKKTGFDILGTIGEKNVSKFKPSDFPLPFNNISEEDIVTSGLYVIARKPPVRSK